MYKDKDKQKEANRQAAKEYREKRRNAIEGMTNEGMTTAPKNVIPVIPSGQGMTGNDVKNKIVSDAEYARITKGTEVIMPKRGKDIKCFEDLPADVQETINKMSMVDGKIDEVAKVRRAKIAIHYQTTCFGPQGM